MGMYTAVANSQEWSRKFGINVEEIDQWELVRRSETAADRRRLVERRRGSGSSASPREMLVRCGRLLRPSVLSADRRLLCDARLVEDWTSRSQGSRANRSSLTTSRRWISQRPSSTTRSTGRAKEPPRCATEAGHGRGSHDATAQESLRSPVLFSDMRHYHSDQGFGTSAIQVSIRHGLQPRKRGCHREPKACPPLPRGLLLSRWWRFSPSRRSSQ